MRPIESAVAKQPRNPTGALRARQATLRGGDRTVPVARRRIPALRRTRANAPCRPGRAGVAGTQRKFATDAHATWERCDKIASLMMWDGGKPWEANPDGNERQ